MGRLPLVAIALSMACVACDEPSSTPPKSRADSVGMSAKPTASAPPPTASVRPPTRKLCSAQTLRDAPELFDTSRAAGGRTGPSALEIGGRWVWINVWAAWCEPCKKEMPMLLAWRDKLRAGGVKVDLVFVSIDDDERELTRFLDKQPNDGVRASYWLGAEDARKAWFSSVGYDEEPALPVNVFVRPDEKVACVESGALHPGDYEAVAALVR